MRTPVGLLALALALVGLRAAAEPPGPGAVEALLGGYRTERALTAFLGKGPTRCVAIW